MGRLKQGQIAFKCPRCGVDLVFGKKRGPNYVCHACGQHMFLTEERLANPELLRRSVELFREENKPYSVVIKNRTFKGNSSRKNNYINR